MGRRIVITLKPRELDQKRFYTTEKGERICKLVLFETPNSKFSEWGLKQDRTKEEIEKNEKPNLPFVGDGKNHGWDEPRGGRGRRDEPEYTDDGEEIPF